MLVEGGSEKYYGWSEEPYGWAVEKSLSLNDSTLVKQIELVDRILTGRQPEKLHFYPNPANSTIFLSGADNYEMFYTLWTAKGKIVRSDVLPGSGSMISLDISDIEPGIYLFVIRSSKGEIVHSEKLLKQ